MTKSATNRIIFKNRLGFLKIDSRDYINSKFRAFERKKCGKRSAWELCQWIIYKVTILSDWTISVIFKVDIVWNKYSPGLLRIILENSRNDRAHTGGNLQQSNTRRKTRTSQSESHYATFEHSNSNNRSRIRTSRSTRREAEPRSYSHGVHPIEDNGLRIAPVEADPITELNSELAATTNNSRSVNSK